MIPGSQPAGWVRFPAEIWVNFHAEFTAVRRALLAHQKPCDCACTRAQWDCYTPGGAGWSGSDAADAEDGFGLCVTPVGRSQAVYGALGGTGLFVAFVFLVATSSFSRRS
jgi:hypothetical protein